MLRCCRSQIRRLNKLLALLTHMHIAMTSLASQPYFSAYAHARAKVGGGREGKIPSFPRPLSHAHAHMRKNTAGSRD